MDRLRHHVTLFSRRPAMWRPGHHVVSWVTLAHQFVLVGLAALAYFGVRGVTQSDVGSALDHAAEVVRLERSVGVAWEDAFQELVIGQAWLTTAVNWIYIYGHWPVVIAVLVWLFAKHPNEYFTLRDAMFISGAIGLVIFILYPTAPPRLAELGLVDTVTERSSSYRTLQPPGLINKYAAMPSLHFGWNLIVGVMAARATRNRVVQALAILLPVGMAFAVVATANHFVLDVVAGGLVALAGLALVPAVNRRIAALTPAAR